MKEQIKWTEYAIFACLMSALGLVWYNAYVKPHAEYRRAVMNCMTEAGDMSREAYQNCIQK